MTTTFLIVATVLVTALVLISAYILTSWWTLPRNEDDADVVTDVKHAVADLNRALAAAKGAKMMLRVTVHSMYGSNTSIDESSRLSFDTAHRFEYKPVYKRN